jgi:hypothetical protein
MSCSTSGIRRITPVTNPVRNRELLKDDRNMNTVNGISTINISFILLSIYYLSAMFASSFTEYEILARMGGYDGK